MINLQEYFSLNDKNEILQRLNSLGYEFKNITECENYIIDKYQNKDIDTLNFIKIFILECEDCLKNNKTHPNLIENIEKLQNYDEDLQIYRQI